MTKTTDTIEILCEECNAWLSTGIDYDHVNYLDICLEHFGWIETDIGYLCPDCKINHFGGNA